VRLRDFVHGPEPCTADAGPCPASGFFHVVEPTTVFTPGWHLDVICDYLERVTRREIRQLVINEPPGCMKTLLASVFWPAWQWGEDPGHRWLAASHDPEVVLRDAGRIIQILRDERYQALFPRCRLKDPGSPAEGNFDTTAGGCRISESVGGSLIGKHFDTKLIDDPSKPLDVTSRSKVSLDRVREWFSGSVSPRNTHPERTATVLIMQRLHEADLAAHLISLGYTALVLPLEYEPDAEREAYDRRRRKGERLWPARHTATAVERLKKELGTAANTAAQLQQNPTPDSGGIVERAWFRRYSALPTTGPGLTWFQTWDLADKGSSESHSHVSGTLWAHRPGELYLVDEVNDLLNYPKTKEVFAARQGRTVTGAADPIAARKWPLWARNMPIDVEEKASGVQLIQELGSTFRMIHPTNPKDSKADRLRVSSAQIEVGGVFVPEGGRWDPWLDEVVGFPRRQRDDRVDTLTAACERARGTAGRYEAALRAMVNLR
jgi:predicted phage terminase large subunit-like protein